MQTSSLRNILTIFLASPSDLSSERQLAREVVDDLNKCIGRFLGWQLELLGWEDTLPGLARPQALINQDAAACDLFIGLLWKRWGQSTGGGFSSGFEEEFTIARNRNGKEGNPEIWLAFKQVDPDVLKDPGDHLKKVIQFKSDRETSKDILFKEFVDEADWSRLLRNWLLTYVLKLAIPTLQEIATPLDISTSASGDRSASLPDEAGIEATVHHEQIEKLFDVIRQCKDGYPFVPDSSGENIISSFQISRLYLLSSTWFALMDRRKLLETYVAVRLYESRDLLEATSYELQLITRTIFADKFDLVPGWYWLRALQQSDDIQRIMIHLLMEDQSEDIKLNILSLMSDVGIQLPTEQQHRTSTIKTLLGDASEKVTEAILSYLTKHGLPQDLEILDQFSIDNAKFRGHTLATRIAILSRESPDTGFSLALDEPDAIISKSLGPLSAHSAFLSIDLLEKGLRHPQATVRKFSATELFQRDKLSDASIEFMTKDTSVRVRELAYMQQMKRGIKVDIENLGNESESKGSQAKGLLSSFFTESIDIDELTRFHFNTLSSDDLKKELDWLSPHGHIAYETLATKYFPVIADRIRNDLNDDFESLRNESVQSRAVKFGIENQLPSEPFREALEEMIKREKDAIRKFKLKRFGVSALAGIALHGVKSDAGIGRRYLSLSEKGDVRLRKEAIKILEKFGDESDVEMLVTIAKESDGTLRNVAATAALKLSMVTRLAANEFVRSDSPFLVSRGLTSLWLLDRQAALDKATELLGSEIGSVRVAALHVISKELTIPEMKSMLDAYMGRSEYYYNVVCWLDRMIYAVPLKSAYQSRLESTVYS